MKTRQWNSPREANRKKNENRLRYEWDNIKQNNISIKGVSVKERKRDRGRKRL